MNQNKQHKMKQKCSKRNTHTPSRKRKRLAFNTCASVRCDCLACWRLFKWNFLKWIPPSHSIAFIVPEKKCVTFKDHCSQKLAPIYPSFKLLFCTKSFSFNPRCRRRKRDEEKMKPNGEWFCCGLYVFG